MLSVLVCELALQYIPWVALLTQDRPSGHSNPVGRELASISHAAECFYQHRMRGVAAWIVAIGNQIGKRAAYTLQNSEQLYRLCR
jgi:hypothetical protein